MSQHMGKIVAGTAIASMVLVGLAGCASELDQAKSSAESTIDSLEYLGDATKIVYKERVHESTDEAGALNIASEAGHVNDVVGTQLVLFDLEQPDSQFMLNPDGTVTADPFASAMMSKPVKWRTGLLAFELCPQESCEFYSSWQVTFDEAQNQYTFTLMGGEETGAGLPVRMFFVK